MEYKLEYTVNDELKSFYLAKDKGQRGKIPKTIDGFPVRVKVTGPFLAY